MPNDRLSETQRKILLAHYQASRGGANALKPSNVELAHKIGVTPPAIHIAKKGLREYGYLTEADVITHKGLRYLEATIDIFPSEFPIIGEVQAGEKPGEDLQHNATERSEFFDSHVPRLPIPRSENPADTVALVVRGDSMKDHDIFDGDHVLVELFGDDGPKEGELIVTYYLPPSYRGDEHIIDDIAGIEFDPSMLHGPTLKYYSSKVDSIRLSPLTNADYNEYKIETLAVRPVGRVVGVYREIKPKS